MERVFYPNDIITIVQVVVKALEIFQIAKINVEDIFWIYSAYMINDIRFSQTLILKICFTFLVILLFHRCLSFRGKVAIISLKLLHPPFPGSDWTLSSNFPKTFTELR